jgi:hypothetical protein
MSTVTCRNSWSCPLPGSGSGLLSANNPALLIVAMQYCKTIVALTHSHDKLCRDDRLMWGFSWSKHSYGVNSCPYIPQDGGHSVNRVALH